MNIRNATVEDVQAIAHLMNLLGYPTTVEQMKKRFHKIKENPNHYTLVACKDEKVIGMVGFYIDVLYNADDLYARIIAFVIDENYRRQGAGRMLLKQAETIAKDLGAKGIGLNSGNRPERKISHQFYQSMGYVAKSTGFVKNFEA